MLGTVKRLFKKVTGKQPEKDKRPLRTAEVLDRHLSKHFKVWSLNQITKTSLILFAILAAMLSSWVQNYSDVLKGKHVAIIKLEGEITTADGGTGYSAAKAFQQAVKDEKAAAILIEVDSGGGSPTEGELLYSVIENYISSAELPPNPNKEDTLATVQFEAPDGRVVHFPAPTRKPVYVSVRGMCASACYYAIAGADKIFTHKNSLIGSIGIRMDAYDVRELSEKLGVDKVTLSSGENKTILDPFRGVTEEDRDLLQNTIIKPLYSQFISDIETARDGKLLSDYPGIYSGMVFPGHKAIDIGFADEVKTTIEVEQYLIDNTQATYTRVVNNPPFSFSRMLQSSISGAVKAVLKDNIEAN